MKTIDPNRAEDGAMAAVFDAIELELTWLGRGLEAVQRRRTYPLDRAQYLLLLSVQAQGPQTVMDLAQRLMLDSSTVTRQVTTMEERGLIDRLPNPDDGRSVMIQATRHGLREAGKMRAMRLRRIETLFAGWTAQERATFATQLGKFNATLAEVLASEES